jgi:hypothetical protein
VWVHARGSSTLPVRTRQTDPGSRWGQPAGLAHRAVRVQLPPIPSRPRNSVDESAALRTRRTQVRILSGALSPVVWEGWAPASPTGCNPAVTHCGGSTPPLPTSHARSSARIEFRPATAEDAGSNPAGRTMCGELSRGLGGSHEPVPRWFDSSARHFGSRSGRLEA